MSLLILISLSPIMGLTRTITDDQDTIYGYITNSNGKYWEASCANIQNAIDDLTSGGTVYLPEGEIEIDTEITLLDNVNIIGIGTGTILFVADGMDANHCFNVYQVENVTIRDLLIDGNKDNQGEGNDASLNIESSKNVLIDNVHVINGWDGALRCEWSEFVSFVNCYTNNSGDDGISFNFNSTHCSAINNIIENTGYGTYDGFCCGIEVEDGARHIVLDGNTIKNFRNYGIGVWTHTDVGQNFRVCENIVISNNVITSDGGTGDEKYGIWVTGKTQPTEVRAFDITVDANVINVTGIDAGIKFIRVTDSLCSNNIVNEGDKGIIVESVDNCTFLNNDVNGSDDGFYLSGVEDSEFSNNRIYASTNGIYLTNTNTSIFTDNTLLDGYSGIRGAGTSSFNKISDNFIGRFSYRGIEFEAQATNNNTYSDNTIVDCFRGIHLYGDNENMINNVIYATDAGGGNMEKGICFKTYCEDSYFDGNIVFGQSNADQAVNIETANSFKAIVNNVGTIYFEGTSEIELLLNNRDYLNNSLFPLYEQASPPTLLDNCTAYWYNTTGGWLYQVAYIYGTQYYINMTTDY